MRLHAKLLGNNPRCVFPIWLVYCTFKRTERIKYTLWTGTTSQPFWKARAMGILLLSPRLYRPSSPDSSISFLFCKTHTWFHLCPSHQYCRNWSPFATGFLQNMGVSILCPVQSRWMSALSNPVQISHYGTILHLQCNPHSQPQITRIMVNGNKQTKLRMMPEFWQVSTFCPITV